ncbi:transcriptional regulator, PadR family [Agromyces sp. CF514]|nr:PadR family transcriptional regulator [Agromyces sp. CF514]SFR87618.1 transcriptional regulator, PadR family [Agromyces sp. CF514]
MSREHFIEADFRGAARRHDRMSHQYPQRGEGRFHHDPGFGRPHHGPGAWGDFPGGPGGPGFGFGPGGRGGRRRSKGDVRAAILSLLAENPSNGYAIIKAVADKTEGAWRPSPGSVYPTLQQLVDEGLIVAVGEGRKTEFQLTDDGRAYVAEHEDEIAGAWASVPKPSESATELFQAVGRLMGVVGQFRHGATDEQRAAATAKLDETRKALYLILAE